AKSERGDSIEIVDLAYFAGRVTLEGERGVFARHAFAVVGDANFGEAALLDLDADFRGAGVERVFDELFDDARGSFDDLAGGDLIREVFGQLVDLARSGAHS